MIAGIRLERVLLQGLVVAAVIEQISDGNNYFGPLAWGLAVAIGSATMDASYISEGRSRRGTVWKPQFLRAFAENALFLVPAVIYLFMARQIEGSWGRVFTAEHPDRLLQTFWTPMAFVTMLLQWPFAIRLRYLVNKSARDSSILGMEAGTWKALEMDSLLKDMEEALKKNDLVEFRRLRIIFEDRATRETAHIEDQSPFMQVMDSGMRAALETLEPDVKEVEEVVLALLQQMEELKIWDQSWAQMVAGHGWVTDAGPLMHFFASAEKPFDKPIQILERRFRRPLSKDSEPYAALLTAHKKISQAFIAGIRQAIEKVGIDQIDSKKELILAEGHRLAREEHEGWNRARLEGGGWLAMEGNEDSSDDPFEELLPAQRVASVKPNISGTGPGELAKETGREVTGLTPAGAVTTRGQTNHTFAMLTGVVGLYGAWHGLSAWLGFHSGNTTLLVIGGTVLVLDQISKILVRHVRPNAVRPTPVSALTRMVAPIVLSLAVVYILSFNALDVFPLVSRFGLSLLIGGALSNSWEAALRGTITDWIPPRFRRAGPWNVADIANAIGASILLYSTLAGHVTVHAITAAGAAFLGVKVPLALMAVIGTIFDAPELPAPSATTGHPPDQ